jgi:hypothetical protein
MNEAELKATVAELRAILQDALKLLDPGSQDTPKPSLKS